MQHNSFSSSGPVAAVDERDLRCPPLTTSLLLLGASQAWTLPKPYGTDKIAI